jgi:ATP-binding cassette subfamily F protein uup
LRSYPGNFAQYQINKEEQMAQEAVISAKADKLLAQEEVWIRKGVEARRTRSQSRIARLETLRATRSARREQVGRVRMEVASGAPTGKLVAELTDVCKSFTSPEGDVKVILKDFTATLLRGDKIGLLGPNGAGKTTLLKMILGELEADSGKIRQGANLQVAYFDQMRNALDLEASLEDFISPGSEWIEIGNKRQHVKSYLGDFLFSPARATSPVKSLSGGERNRLLLARLFARPANVLVLDEPTNDLDIDTLELLEELLQDYQGTVFLVSHDRAFMDNVRQAWFLARVRRLGARLADTITAQPKHSSAKQSGRCQGCAAVQFKRGLKLSRARISQSCHSRCEAQGRRKEFPKVKLQRATRARWFARID